MTEYPTDPAAYDTELFWGEGGLVMVKIVHIDSGDEVAVYDGEGPVTALIEGARNRERGEPGTDKLPSDAALIEEALWDAGLVEDDAEGEVARALDAYTAQVNARLIAAAPDMLAALQAVVDRYAPAAAPANDAIAVMWADARAAIAKATGA